MKEITNIISRFPSRKYILIGDSGESDPEIYSRIYSKYPDNIALIIIRFIDDSPDPRDIFEKYKINRHLYRIIKNFNDFNSSY